MFSGAVDAKKKKKETSYLVALPHLLRVTNVFDKKKVWKKYDSSVHLITLV